jgi:hypothetical protein
MMILALPEREMVKKLKKNKIIVNIKKNDIKQGYQNQRINVIILKKF